MRKSNPTETAFWTVLFLVLGTGLLIARQSTDGAWPLLAACVAYFAAGVFAWRLLVSDR